MTLTEEQQRALSELIRTGQLGKAALLARTVGNPRYAARLFLEAKLPYQAAVCFYEAGDARASLDAFLRVSKGSDRYRSACANAVRIADELGTLTFEVDRYVAEFVDSDPRDAHEVSALHQLSVLYQRHQLFDHAREALLRVTRADPNHTDASQRLATIEALIRSTPAVYAEILREDSKAWRAPRSGYPPPRAAQEPPSSDAADASWSVAMPALVQEPTLRSPGSAVAPALDLGPASVIAHRYQIEAELGRGGMGIVYRAIDLELDEPVAIKVFSQRLEEHALLHRFKQELTLCRKLAHPNIVRLYDIGAHAGRKFISLELLLGASLKTHIKTGVELPRALRYLSQICEGLGVAHAQGVVHRDIKPDNIFVTTRDIVKIMDFGLAKKQGDNQDVTVTGFIAGSPGYMAPEQITDFGSATQAADLYSLGVLAYELVTGRKPFRHKDRQKVLEMQLTQEPERPRALNAHVPPALEELILLLLRKDPGERIASCEDVGARLADIARR
jgi:hypothetical protein